MASKAPRSMAGKTKFLPTKPDGKGEKKPFPFAPKKDDKKPFPPKKGDKKPFPFPPKKGKGG